jgi:hypothetical protein
MEWGKRKQEMAKKVVVKKLKVPRNTLPYVQVAAFCENILEDKDGVISAIRLFDRVNVPPPPPPPPEAGPDALPAIKVNVLVVLKSGSVKGRKTVKLISESPNGSNRFTVETPSEFNGGEWGVKIQIQMVIPIEGEGLYWCNVLVNDAIVTRMPLRVVYADSPTESQEKTTG